MKKALFIFVSVILLMTTYYFINKDTGKDSVFTANEYFPKEIMTKKFSGGFENEGFTHIIDKIEDGKIQIKIQDTGMNMITVYKISQDQISLIYTLENTNTSEEIDFENLIENKKDVIIKSPIKKGSKWMDDKNGKYEITGVNIEVNTPAGKFDTIEVTYKNNDFEIKRYYAKNIGLVKNIYNHELTDELIDLEYTIDGFENSDFGVNYGEGYIFLRKSYYSLDNILGKALSVDIQVLDERADTYKGSRIRTSSYDGLVIEEFAPEDTDNFWVMSIDISNKNYSTVKGLTIGDKLDKLKELYTVEIVKDGRVDPNNCAYVFKHSMEYNFIVFEVKSGIIEHIKIYNELQ